MFPYRFICFFFYCCAFALLSTVLVAGQKRKQEVLGKTQNLYVPSRLLEWEPFFIK